MLQVLTHHIRNSKQVNAWFIIFNCTVFIILLKSFVKYFMYMLYAFFQLSENLLNEKEVYWSHDLYYNLQNNDETNKIMYSLVCELFLLFMVLWKIDLIVSYLLFHSFIQRTTTVKHRSNSTHRIRPSSPLSLRHCTMRVAQRVVRVTAHRMRSVAHLHFRRPIRSALCWPVLPWRSIFYSLNIQTIMFHFKGL